MCLGGGLHFSERALRIFPKETPLAAFALSDPYGLAASVAIAPQFDLFYTQDPQTLPDYALRHIAAQRCDPATDPELYRPERAAPECDILYYGKWTPYRDGLVAALARALSRARARVRGRDAVERSGAAAARHARRAARRAQPLPPRARDGPSRRRPGTLPRASSA